MISKSVLDYLKPKNESKRLAALNRYKLLDTQPEQSFDDFTHLAAYICDTPIASVTLIDKNRQWFKSKLGLENSEGPREHSFCSHTVLEGRMLVIENALEDARFAKNPLVTSDPNIRFYAGAPLVDHEGFALGALCVIDRRPRQLNAAQLAALERLARQVTKLCEYRRSSLELSDALQEIKVLQGLLPICMHCKSIRNDSGFWNSVEEYVGTHSDVSFSHGCCAKCLKLNYPEAYDELVSQGKIGPA